MRAVAPFMTKLIPSTLKPALRRLLGKQPPQYLGVATRHGTRQLHKGRFAEIFDRCNSFDPYMGENTIRMRVYFVASFAKHAMSSLGDLAFVGVSYGVTARTCFEFANVPATKAIHLIDPFTAARSNANRISIPRYNRDPNLVINQYPESAKIVIHRNFIPDCLPLTNAKAFCFVHLNTSDPESEALSIPYFFERLTGAMVIDQYAIHDHRNADAYDRVFNSLSVDPIVLPTGQAVLLR